MNFEITAEESIKIAKWLNDVVYPSVIATQKANIKDPNPFQEFCWEQNAPWEGASGGALTYQFTPTSIGLVSKVKYSNGSEKHELDFTDYDMW